MANNRGKVGDRWRGHMTKVGKQAEGGRNRAREGWAGQGVRASWQEEAGGEGGTLRAK